MRALISSMVALWLLSVLCPSFALAQEQTVTPTQLTRIDAYTYRGARHFVDGYAARAPGGLVNVVVEIPTGTNDKWEVDSQDGLLKWEFRNGQPRVVKFLPYPGNYGMIPNTLLSKEAGGDGDPLDIMVLSPAVQRGSVIQARVICVLRFLDGGEQDDKLLAVLPGTPLGDVTNLRQLQKQFPGALQIVERWFQHYKGLSEMKFLGRGDVDEAEDILDATLKQK